MVFAFTDKMLQYLTVAILALVLIFPIPLPIGVSSSVQQVYDRFEAFPDGSVLYCNIVAASAAIMDASSFPPLVALVQHAFDKNMKVVFCSQASHTPESALYVDWILTHPVIGVNPRGAVYGVDYVYFLAIRSEAGMMSWLEDIRATTPYDYWNTPLDDLPIMDNINDGYDFDLGISAGFIQDQDMIITQAIYGVPIFFAVIDAYGPSTQQFVLSGQAEGALWGARRAAEYEMLLGKTSGQGLATLGQATVICAVFMAIIVYSNIAHPMERKRTRVET
jgi:hypothetical protein